MLPSSGVLLDSLHFLLEGRGSLFAFEEKKLNPSPCAQDLGMSLQPGQEIRH
jgi:hypothetical protein